MYVHVVRAWCVEVKVLGVCYIVQGLYIYIYIYIYAACFQTLNASESLL